MTAPETFLELSAVTRRFDGIVAVNDLSMSVKKNTIHGLIGPNGSGKSTTFNLIAGELPVSAGAIRFKDQTISGLSSHRLAKLGIARTFQATDLFDEFTVVQNLTVAASMRHHSGYWHTLLNTPFHRRTSRQIQQEVERLVVLLGLDGASETPVRDLPHRHQKAVALGNALATDPELLMLDEPAAGLTHQEMEHMMSIYRALQRDGLTILLVEHNMRAVMSLCERITVLNQGRKIAEGTPTEVANNKAVIEAYLGGSATKAPAHAQTQSQKKFAPTHGNGVL